MPFDQIRNSLRNREFRIRSRGARLTESPCDAIVAHRVNREWEIRRKMNRAVRLGCILLLSFLAGCATAPNVPPQSPTQELLNAASGGDAPGVRALLAKGAEVNAKDNNGDTALIMASGMATLTWYRRCSPRGAM